MQPTAPPQARAPDPEFLRTSHYRDPANLIARINLHVRFSTNLQGWSEWVFDQLLRELPARATILETGAGPATLWVKNRARLPAGWRVRLTDFSRGMVASATRALAGDPRFACETADAAALPAPAGSHDAVVAHHMLYHVPDRAAALREFHRVLAPGGLLSIALNGRAHLRELVDLVRGLPGVRIVADPGDLEGLDLERAPPEIGALFDDVRTLHHEDALAITEAAPLVAYLASDFRFAVDDREELARALEARIAGSGAIRVAKTSGLIHARRPA